MKISGLVLAKDEEENIGDCIKNLSFCDEVVVVDDFSSDKTFQIAAKMRARVFRRRMDENYSKQLNFGVRKAKFPWVFVLDADERVSKGLIKSVRSVVRESGDFSAYKIKRIDFFLGRKIFFGDVKDFYDIRLVRRGRCLWERRVHPKCKVEGKVGVLKGEIFHHSHGSLYLFLAFINKWSSWHALANKEEKKDSGILKIVFFPFYKFVYNYFLKLGFRDGSRGFLHAFLMSCHSFFSWSKLWMIEREN